MRFPPSFLDAIRARIPIADVVGRRVTWDKRKSQPSRGDYWACCPFHGEKTPSFHADNRRGHYHCFGCGVSGDHFTFLVELDGMSFPEAVTELAREAGLQLPDPDPREEAREARRTGLAEVMEKAAAYFEKQLAGPDGARARAYLRERGLAAETVARFRLGYAPASRNALKGWLAEAGVKPEEMAEAGLVIAGDDIPVSYDRFRDRLIFPILDFRGKVIAFGGRALSADAQPKYLNSPETPLFSKSRVLFNGQAARASSARGGRLVVVEGYMDVIACVAAGFEAAVAPLGTALTEDQLQLLWQMADEPTLCFDGDNAGVKAAERAIDLALPHLKPGRSLAFALLPEGQDPDDLIRASGREALSAVLDAASPLAEMLWRREMTRGPLDTPERLAGAEKALKSAVAQIGDADVRRHYDELYRDRLFERRRQQSRPGAGQGAPFSGGNQRGAGRGRAKPGGFAGRPDWGEASPSLLSTSLVRGAGRAGAAISLSDAILVGALLAHPDLAGERLEKLGDMAFADAALADLAAALSMELSQEPDLSAEELAARLKARTPALPVSAVTGKLASAGLSDLLVGGDASRAAAIWDDAALLRLRTTTLSNARRAAARDLAEEAVEGGLTRLKDIQEEDLRLRHRAFDEERTEAVLLHPFKAR
ncbi:DNA primase [Afifella sp. IM 167]|uniref:DNA primase n=1 Tax=Afifella sp. IM 167 TaxID=2033586 RepID=UPI001CCDB763|nr:DNA primase [Afifella sp. IM 167]MBZ8132183.1 DNA primase [Afifella sp. IM 167]